jgi:hypothetical protein
MNRTPAIERAIYLAISEGNQIAESSSGWAKVNEVVHFRFPMTPRLRDAVSAEKTLRFWSSEATPHSKAEEGFIDDASRVALSFPK